MVQPRIRGEEYRTSIVCIDRYRDDVPEGRIYHPGGGSSSFRSLSQFLSRMEDHLDEWKLPRSFTAIRSFGAAPELTPGRPEEGESKRGGLATFALRILFRQNASWQGSVTWMETGRTESFRSALELIFLTDSALREVRAD